MSSSGSSILVDSPSDSSARRDSRGSSPSTASSSRASAGSEVHEQPVAPVVGRVLAGPLESVAETPVTFGSAVDAQDKVGSVDANDAPKSSEPQQGKLKPPASETQVTSTDAPADAAHASDYAYEYDPNAVFEDVVTSTAAVDAHDKKGDEGNEQGRTEADPYTYSASDVERVAPMDPPPRALDRASMSEPLTTSAPAEAVVRVRPTVCSQDRPLPQSDLNDITSTPPALLNEVIRRRSFSSSPYVVTSPTAPLSTREANLLELLETALKLTDVLTHTLQTIDSEAPRRLKMRSSSQTSSRPPRPSQGRSTSQPPRARVLFDTAGDVSHCCRCEACAKPFTADAGRGCGPRTRLNSAQDPEQPLPATQDKYVIAGRWEAQLRRPDPPQRLRVHSVRPRAHSSAALPRTTDNSAWASHERRTDQDARHTADSVPMSHRHKGTFPFTSRAPARAPVNATNRFVISRRSRSTTGSEPRHAAKKKTTDGAVASTSTARNDASTHPPLSSSCTSRRHEEEAHTRAAVGTNTHASTEQPVTRGKRRSAAHHPHCDHRHALECCAFHDFRHDHTDVRAGSPAHQRPQQRRPQQSKGHHQREPAASAEDPSSTVGSEFDYCLRQLRDDYWSQSHQVLEQLENMLRHGE